MVGQTTADIAANDLLYLKLDQTTHQHIDNGAPHFDEGIEVKAGKRLYLDGA